MNYRNSILGMSSGAALIGAAMLLPAAAQTVNDEDSPPGTNRLETVTVTATKRGEDVQDIGASVTAIGGSDIEDRGIDNIEALSLQVPSVVFGEYGGASFVAIRGVGSTVDTGIAEPTVATYVDGVNLPRPTMGFLRQVDLERVEVLRGPQGTLYGRNATAGAVNFVSRAPSETFEGAISGTVADRDGYGADGFISGPIADGLLFRLSGGFEKQDGFIDVLPNREAIADTDVIFVRGAVRIEPSNSLSIDLSAKYEETDENGTGPQLFTPAGVFIPPGTPQTTEPNAVVADGPYASQVETLLLAGTINWEINDAVSFRSITGYIDHDSTTTFDADSTGFGFYNTVGFVRPSETFTQEFNLFGATDRLDWLVGAYYYNEDFFTSLPVNFPNGLNTGDPASSVPPGAFLEQMLGEETESYALFADLTYALTDRLRVNGGLRWNNETKDFLWTFGATIPGAGFFGVENVPNSLEDDAVLPKLGVQYDLTDDVMAYGQWQKGQKSGGQNLTGPELYDSEEITSYEAGLKSRLFDDRATLNVAAFFYEYDGLQVTNIIPPTTTVIQNADAEVRGAEAEFVMQVTDELNVSAGLTLLDSEYTAFSSLDPAFPLQGVQDLSGAPLNRSPDSTYNIAAEYTFQLGLGLLDELTLRGELFHSDELVLRYFGTSEDTQEAYTIANLSAVLTDASGKTSLRLFANNVGDEEIKQSIIYLQTQDAYYGSYSEPFNWGLRLTRKF